MALNNLFGNFIFKKEKLMKLHHGNLDLFSERILDAYKNSKISKATAISILGHVIAAVEKGNESEAQNWITNPEFLDEVFRKEAIP